MSDDEKAGTHKRWAHLRFSVVGPLLAAPPAPGELQIEFERLAAKSWLHPITERPTRFGVSTIQRWYYAARAGKSDPVGVLRRKMRNDAGQQPSMGDEVRRLLETQYGAHKRWSHQLHFDNLGVVVAKDPRYGRMPSYSSVLRYMKNHGLFRSHLPSGPKTPGLVRAQARIETREVRSFESEHVNALWHLDFHHGSHKILTPEGEYVKPLLLGIMDDHSRLVCHAQWYLGETAEDLVHGLCQAFLKRGLPRSLLTDSVPRHRIGVLWPRSFCARFCGRNGAVRDSCHSLTPGGHKTGYSELSQARSDWSSCQAALRGNAPLTGSSQVRSAASFVRVVISA